MTRTMVDLAPNEAEVAPPIHTRRPVVAPRRPPTRLVLARPRVEPLPELEWALATEPGVEIVHAGEPAELRRAWIHGADEHQVVALFQETVGPGGQVAAPWWLTALAAHRLPSRTAGFEFEDAVHALLHARRGWVYVPWVCEGEDGYWEFAPSEPDSPAGGHPTTVTLTAAHDGWLDVAPAGEDAVRLPLAGVAGLAERIDEIESWRADLPRQRAWTGRDR
ncbi:hypothetical protein [Streptoalloteichus hindustanus]|uniref:Uncharacterized protein n=1 Tax=Streptoalloteichus hindustanus TaxID=2017 RepID=A0A1M4UUP9_STRHI|nr:hypothetical protein [Streptoalloteichus hindustanus]SHE60414.1 hypothetical protein SAMN05444320_101549 [Streptoalloteichus hindustanus]